MKNLYFLSLILAVVVLSLPAYSQQTETMDPKAAAYYNSAIQFMKAEQYEDALKSIDSSLMIAKDYRIYYLQGQANSKLGKLQEAINSYNESVKLKPDYDAGWMAAGNANLAAKDYEQAINNFNKAAEVTSDAGTRTDAIESVKFAKETQSIDIFNKGNELNKQGKFEEAIAMYDKALAIQKDSKFHFQKGIVLSKVNKMKEAEQELKSAIALNDSFDMAYVALGGIQSVNKDYEGAIKSYETAGNVTTNENLKNSIKESILKTYVAAGNYYYKEKKYDQSIQWLQKSVGISPSDEGYLGLARSYIEKKKYADALSSLDSAKANQKAITDGAVAYYRGVVFLNQNNDQKALEQFNIAVTDPPYKKASQAQIDYLKAKMKGKK